MNTTRGSDRYRARKAAGRINYPTRPDDEQDAGDEPAATTGTAKGAALYKSHNPKTTK